MEGASAAVVFRSSWTCSTHSISTPGQFSATREPNTDRRWRAHETLELRVQVRRRLGRLLHPRHPLRASRSGSSSSPSTSTCASARCGSATRGCVAGVPRAGRGVARRAVARGVAGAVPGATGVGRAVGMETRELICRWQVGLSPNRGSCVKRCRNSRRRRVHAREQRARRRGRAVREVVLDLDGLA